MTLVFGILDMWNWIYLPFISSISLTTSLCSQEDVNRLR